MFIVSGLHVDRPWPNLVPSFGRALREWSLALLPEVVDQAKKHEADTIVVLGDLLHRATVLPDTVDHIAEVLGTFPGRVLIAPGRRDWAGDSGPYERATFAPNTEVWSSESYSELPSAPGVFGSAWTSATSNVDPPRRGGSPGTRRIWVRPEGNTTGWADKEPTELFITSGPTFHAEEGVFVAPHVVQEPGATGSNALLLDLTDEGVNAQIVSLPPQPGSRAELDVTPLLSTASLGRALASASRGRTPVHLSLVGTLAPGVLLPGSGGPMPSEDVQLDLSALEYADPPHRAGDHSMIAEFLRAMADSPDDARTRHQVTALGLQALTTEPNAPTS